ncbi:hypothetical protein QAD02_020968 [Eretmocerus hayati]|uniref:Uncharacterized protein n=1 Tax=Eretmocerus hayati TaxID=131215 RepID=A0ACC2PP43_9HYME|nr:hypothetical protein QAD02_020968 [Eretmocerus hayati]
MFSCEFCEERLKDRDRLIKHLIQIHSHEKKLNVPCGKEGCSKVFNNPSSRRSHISRVHQLHADRAALPPSQRTEPVRSLSMSASNSNTEDHVANFLSQKCSNDDSLINGGKKNSTDPDSIPQLKNFAHNKKNVDQHNPQISNEIALVPNSQSQSMQDSRKKIELRLLLKMRKQCLPDSFIQSVIGDVKELIYCCIANHVPPEVAEECTEIFNDLKTKWKQDRYLKENTDLIPPKEILLDSKFKKSSQPEFGMNRKIVKCHDTFYFVSIVETIVKFFQ